MKTVLLTEKVERLLDFSQEYAYSEAYNSRQMGGKIQISQRSRMAI